MANEQVDGDELDYQEVLGKLEDAAFLDIVQNSDEWKVLHRAWKHIRDKGRDSLCVVDPHDWKRIAIIQLQCQFYDDVIGNTLRVIKEEGKEAYEAAKERNWLQRVMGYIKERI